MSEGCSCCRNYKFCLCSKVVVATKSLKSYRPQIEISALEDEKQAPWLETHVEESNAKPIWHDVLNEPQPELSNISTELLWADLLNEPEKKFPKVDKVAPVKVEGRLVSNETEMEHSSSTMPNSGQKVCKHCLATEEVVDDECLTCMLI